MRIFDPHIHMTSRTTDDYQAMYDAGVRALVEPSFWLGQPRTRTQLADGIAAELTLARDLLVDLGLKELP
ncbi:hypothetical protein SMICM304S_00182 [Streptomyces microflavus]